MFQISDETSLPPKKRTRVDVAEPDDMQTAPSTKLQRDTMGLITENCAKYFTVIILTFINLLNYTDRYTLAGILPELQNASRNGWHESVTDTEGGLLQTAFIVSYMLLSPVFGYLGDRYSRKLIIGFGIIFWSGFTLTGSFATSYTWLLVSRLFVGIGEASYATIAPTIIADLFPTERRLRMLATFYIAVPLGSGLGYIVGSWVSSIVHETYHEQTSWRWALRVTPTFGVLSAVLVLLFVVDPPRGHVDGRRSRSSKGQKGKSGVVAYFDDVWYCLKNKTFVLTTIGFTAVAFMIGALAQWAPTFVLRVSNILLRKPYTEKHASIVFGAITVVAGLSGTVVGSELSKFLGKYTRKAEVYVCSLSMIVGGPLLYIALSVLEYRSLYAAWILVFLAEFFLCLNWVPVSAVLLYCIIPVRRSTAEAIQILFSHLLGDAISPTIVGGISDAVAKNLKGEISEDLAIATGMEYGLYITAFIGVLGGAAFLAASMTVERDRKAAEQYASSHNVQIQRSEDDDSTSDGFDEHRNLLGDALDEQIKT